MALKNARREKLQPCAHCGGKAGLCELPASVRLRYAVRCTKCFIQTAWTGIQSIAVTMWNRRVK